MALKNEDLNAEIWEIVRSQKWTIVDLSARLGIPQSNFYRILKRDHVAPILIKLMDVLGYDVEIRFVRKRGRRHQGSDAEEQ